MRLLLDFGAIKTGGGVQLATNFLASIRQNSEHIEKVFLLVPTTGPLSQIDLDGLCDGYTYYPNSYISRKLFEVGPLKNFITKHNIDIIYTFFGAGLPRVSGVNSVVSVAYPIICYPDSPYWTYISMWASLKKRLVNALRRRRIRKADMVVVETSIMAERVIDYVNVPKEKVTIISPSPSMFIGDSPFTNDNKSEQVRILLLSGVDPHKNLWRLPAIASQLDISSDTNFKFVISVKKEDFLSALPKRDEVDESLLKRRFEFVGGIPVDKIESVYNSSHFLLNISDLESFSNNYMEAWKSGLPLICSDTDFARNICGDSAVYIDPHNIKVAAEMISSITGDTLKQKALVSEGKVLLSKLPDASEKFEKIFLTLKRVIS